MTSNAKASSNGTAIPKVTSPSDLFDRRKTSSSFASSNNRTSFTSTETGESSSTGSKRNSYNTNGTVGAVGGLQMVEEDDRVRGEQPVKEKSSFKSHRNKASGGFLLSAPVSGPTILPGTIAQTASNHRSSLPDSKSRTLLRSPDKKRPKRRSNVGLGLGASPLSRDSSRAANGNGKEIESRTVANGGSNTRSGTTDDYVVPKGTIGGLDVDSAQIVNLALNLSESRRNASRRFVSAPIPQGSGGLGDGTVGGSLRQHLQQQRRSSRNISPKPDRGDRTMGLPARSTSMSVSSPLQTVFDTQDSEKYEYHFSASTLARAEKARHTIELMAQYRRLLHYVPPLKPQPVDKNGASSDGGHVDGSASSILRQSQSPSATASAPRPLGRPYNPLQYIRNRKVRSRTSKTIDGEAQGFGDLEKVSTWIDKVAQESTTEEYQRADCAMIPKFSKHADDPSSPFDSPQSSNSRSQAAQIKAKRPRIDWITNPADMIADVYWAEQDDHKKLLENRAGHPIFPRHIELKRPFSRKIDDESEVKNPPTPGKVELRLDTQLPEFKSVKNEPERLSDWAANKAKQKLKNLPHIHHSHNSSSSHTNLRFRSKSRSNTDSSDSDEARESSRHRRSGTADSNDRGRNILEKHMQEMLAREASESGQHVQSQVTPRKVKSVENQGTPKAVERPKENLSDHSRSGFYVARLKRDSENNLSSGRASLEVPGATRASIDGFDLRRRSSSMSRTNRIAGVFMGRDRSTSRNRQSSPTRRPLSRIGSKIRPLYNRAMGHDQTDDEDASDFSGSGSKEQAAETLLAIKRGRSLSPTKKTPSKITDGNESSTSNIGSAQKVKSEDSGIRGLFKGPRNTVSKVSDFLWKKDSPGGDVIYDSTTDESDAEAGGTMKAKRKTRSRSSIMMSDEMDHEAQAAGAPSRLMDMPSFTSPFDRRGRARQGKKEEGLSRSLMTKREQADQDEDRKLEAPRIDVQTPSPENNTQLTKRYTRDSSVSAIDPYNPRVQYADARLNSILGIPGGRRNALPVTGLSRLEASNINRRPSVSSDQDHMGWSISDIAATRSPMSKREIARVRVLLLSSGIKAKEISRRAAELHDLANGKGGSGKMYAEIARLAGGGKDLKPVPKSQEHRLAARILSEDIQHSARVLSSSSSSFASDTITSLLSNIRSLNARLSAELTPATRRAADEADEVSKELVLERSLGVKQVGDKMERMVRRRRRRFRWVRGGGWVAVEWVLVGVMWGVWGLVVCLRVLMGVVGGCVAGLRWLFWL